MNSFPSALNFLNDQIQNPNQSFAKNENKINSLHLGPKDVAVRLTKDPNTLKLCVLTKGLQEKSNTLNMNCDWCQLSARQIYWVKEFNGADCRAKKPCRLYRILLCWENISDSGAASCSRPDKCQSAERRVCHFPERSDSMHCCWGRPAGELSECVCVCLYTTVWMGRGLRGSGMLGWVGIRSCVRLCVCDTMKANTLTSKELHSWQSSVTGLSAVLNILLLRYLSSHCEEQFYF